MGFRRLRPLVLWLAAIVAAAAAHPARAQAPAGAPVCHAGAAASEDYAPVAADPKRWTCGPHHWPMAAPRAFLRFDLPAQGPPPTLFASRLTRFEAMQLTVIGADGTRASRDLAEDDMTAASHDWLMTTPLPALAGSGSGSGRARQVVVRIDNGRHAGLLTEARLLPHREQSAAQWRSELLIAALCGMLFLPLVFNFAFYRVLRERFLIWHGAAVACMLAQTLLASGLINRFADLSLSALCFASAFTWGAGIASAAMFSADFLEPGTLDPWHRRFLRGTAPWLAIWTGFYLFAWGGLRPLAQPLYFAAFAPVLALFAWTMLVALRRGSRAVRFQIAAWLPIMLTGVVRIVSALGATEAPLELQLEQHISLALEVIITSLGVADRFMVIRRERDFAVSEIRVVEARAERDHLTGLYNRGAMEQRFARMHAAGFCAMAVIDLDKFKAINDTFGHIIGDAVLRAAAKALEPDADTVAVRIGGEEFMLLLRGDLAIERAERRRQAIATRIAAEVPGLDRVVTASMGLVELPRDSVMQEAEFATLYAHCDRLLYEAKHAGRNRTMGERMQGLAAGSAAHAA